MAPADSSSPPSSQDGAVVVATDALPPAAKAPSSGKLASLTAMTKTSGGYGTHVRSKKQLMISAERKMAPRFLFGVFLTIFM
jgi:hypothetical protein